MTTKSKHVTRLAASYVVTPAMAIVTAIGECSTVFSTCCALRRLAGSFDFSIAHVAIAKSRSIYAIILKRVGFKTVLCTFSTVHRINASYAQGRLKLAAQFGVVKQVAH